MYSTLKEWSQVEWTEVLDTLRALPNTRAPWSYVTALRGIDEVGYGVWEKNLFTCYIRAHMRYECADSIHNFLTIFRYNANFDTCVSYFTRAGLEINNHWYSHMFACLNALMEIQNSELFEVTKELRILLEAIYSHDVEEIRSRMKTIRSIVQNSELSKGLSGE